MKPALVGLLSFLLAVTVAGPGRTAVHASAAPPMACDQAMTIRLPDVKITETAAVPAATTGAIRAAHCRVTGVIGTEIQFRLLLPDDWNGRFMMGGGGGFVGSIQNSAQASVNAGYATVGTDTGHQANGIDASWALDNPERQLNFGYLAVHRTAEVAKALIRGYYNVESRRNYFSGCSRGGGQALMEAQRFPDDFDGIVAGAPAYDWNGLGAALVRMTQIAFPDPRKLDTPLFSADELKMIEATIVDACDAVDGVKDGVIDDPRRCTFDVNTLPLSAAQRTALRAFYEPVKNRDGELYPGRPFGGEGDQAGWRAWIVGGNPAPPQGPRVPSADYGFGTGIYKYLVFNDPSWDYSTYDFSTWKKDTARAATILNATSADLDAFKAKGHKLILWHGWSDPAITPLGSLRYYEQVQARDARVRDSFRMFMMPGVLHCGGGPGPDNADWTAAIVDWVEHGKAPDRVIARKVAAGGAASRTRPLCPYPQHAVYGGSGSTDDEKNFACK